MDKQIIQELFLAFLLIVYANVAIYVMLMHFTTIRKIKELFKINDGIMYMINFTFLLIVGCYMILKYCGN